MAPKDKNVRVYVYPLKAFPYNETLGSTQDLIILCNRSTKRITKYNTKNQDIKIFIFFPLDLDISNFFLKYNDLS